MKADCSQPRRSLSNLVAVLLVCLSGCGSSLPQVEADVEETRDCQTSSALDRLHQIPLGSTRGEVVSVLGESNVVNLVTGGLLYYPNDPPLADYEDGRVGVFEFDPSGKLMRILRLDDTDEIPGRPFPTDLSLEMMVSTARVIMIAEVAKVQPTVSNSNGVTSVELHIHEWMKGRAGGSRVRLEWPKIHNVEPVVGKTYLLFAKRKGDGYAMSVASKLGTLGGVGPYVFGQTYRVLTDRGWTHMEPPEMVRRIKESLRAQGTGIPTPPKYSRPTEEPGVRGR